MCYNYFYCASLKYLYKCHVYVEKLAWHSKSDKIFWENDTASENMELLKNY